jgi:phage shock protein E
MGQSETTSHVPFLSLDPYEPEKWRMLPDSEGPMFVTAGVVLGLIALLVGIRVRFRFRSKDAHRLVAAGALLLDVRTRAEFGVGHLPGAVNVPVQELGTRLDEVGSRTRAIVVYCASGVRSTMAAASLRRAGFEQVINLGPMSAW